MHILETIATSLFSMLFCTFVLGFCTSPIVSVAKFIKSILKYRSAKQNYETDPDESNLEALSRSKNTHVKSTIIMIVIIVAFVAFIAYDFQRALIMVYFALLLSFFAIPCYSVAASLFCFIKYLSLKKKLKNTGEADLLKRLRNKKTAAIIVSVVALFFAFISLVIVHKFGSEISFM